MTPNIHQPMTAGIDRRGLMLVMSSPSGAGKSTLARNLLRDQPELSLSVSVTTRERRGSEIDGKDYHFISQREFELMRDNGGLLEWAEVHGNYYGTPLEPVQKAMSEGRDMLFDIDWQGALQMFDTARADIVSIFILPPSMSELQSRLVRMQKMRRTSSQSGCRIHALKWNIGLNMITSSSTMIWTRAFWK